MSEYNERFDLASSVGNFIIGSATGLAKGISDMAVSVATQPKAFVVATAAETVSTLWNTIVPERFEVRTENFLRSIDRDAAQLLAESPDSVHFASMVAGAFVPAGIGMKMLSMARGGRLALGYSPEAIGASVVGSRQTALATEIEAMFRTAGAESVAYKQLTRKMFTANVVQQVADNIVLEAAVALGMSAHPWMEDYWEEPFKNFALGAVVGGVLGAGFSIPGTKRLLRNVEAPVELERHTAILESGVQFVHPGFTNVARAQAHTKNVGILESLAGDLNNPAPLRDQVNSLLVSERAAAATALERAAPWINAEGTPPELRAQVISLMNDPMFIGVDQIRIFNMDKFEPRTSKAVKIGAGNSTIQESLLTEKGKAATVAVRLGTGDTFHIEGARSAALGADVPSIKTLLEAEAKRTDINLQAPVRDWNLMSEARSKSSAAQNAEFLRELAIDHKMLQKQITNLTVAPDHLSRMNGYIAYADSLTPEQRAQFKVRITGAFPTYQAQREFVQQTVRPDYWHNVDNIVRNSKVLDDYTPESEFIREWVSAVHDQGPRAQLRRAFDAFFRQIPPPKGEEGNVAIAQKIWEKGAPIRESLHAQAANANGKIFLYRGLTKDPVGHSSVESYTNNPNVAGGVFAKEGEGPVLFEIPVENVITAFPLGASTRGGERFHEFLVGPPHHRIVNEVPMQTPSVRAMPIPDTVARMDYDGLVKTYTEATEQQIKDLTGTKKFSPEEISSRLGVTKDGVMHVLGGGRLAGAQNWRMYTSRSPEAMADYIGPKNQLVALTGNPNRNHMAAAYSDLDMHQYRAQMMMETEQLTRSSKSIISNTLLDILGTTGMKLRLDSIHRNLAEIGNALVDRPTLQSADQALRNLQNTADITGLGKLYINTVDRLRKEILEPLAMPFVGLRQNPAKLLEMNRAITKLYSMSGWRDIVEDPLTGKWVIVKKGGPKGEYQFVTHENGDTWYIHQPEVASALNAMREPSKQLLYMHNLNRKLRGYAPLDDMGFYIPPINLVNRDYAFVIDYSGKRGTELLVANTAAELESQIIAWNKVNPASSEVKVVRKGQAEAENLARNYHGGDMEVTYANVAERHSGASALAILPSDTRLLENILQGYETSIIQGGRSYASHYMRDTINWLDHLSDFYQRNVKDQPKVGLKQENVKDAAQTVKNVLLGQDQLGTNVLLKHANNMTEFLINSAGTKIDATWNQFGKGKVNTREYFDQLNRDLASVGIKEPLFQSYDLYLASTIQEARNIAPGVASAGNGIVATMALRFLEIANGAVNIMALPIMTWSALMEKLPGTPIGNGQSTKFPLRVMMDGIRHMFSPQGRAIEARLWEPQGLIDQVLRQFEDTAVNLKRAGMSTSASEQATEALHAVTNNKNFIGLLSKPSDYAEKFTRRFAMHTGYVAAKHAYPGLDDVGATLAAMHFADRTVGNYHAAQRPTLFQGTMGSMLGLYQTYLLTFAQHIYRGIENKNMKQLSSLMLTQAGLFGLKGLPGFNLLSEQVVSQFSNENWDLTTGTYRAVGDRTAEMILYGMPSSITGTAFYTRGDITPRVPGTVTDLALLNTVRQGYELTTNVFSKVAQGAGDGNAVRGFFEALSLQSLNRPIARAAEILLGTSQTKQGNTVSTADQVWTPLGITARLMSARPLEEQITREAIHLNKFYEARDFENRQHTMDRVKTALRAGNLDDNILSSAATEYLNNGGSSQGWRAAMNKTLVNSDQGMRGDLRRKLEPGDPLHTMIDDLH